MDSDTAVPGTCTTVRFHNHGCRRIRDCSRVSDSCGVPVLARTWPSLCPFSCVRTCPWPTS